MKRILLVTPFRNEEASIPHYLKALQRVIHPLYELHWIQNDSTDRTLMLLREAFSIPWWGSWWNESGHRLGEVLHSVKIIGPQQKRPPGEYVKDVPYGGDRIKPWIVLWNKYFIPLARESHAKYFLLWMADCVPPMNVINEYLKVFEEHPDAGWVGGAMHRRHPFQDKLNSPWLKDRGPPDMGDGHFQLPKEVTEVRIASPHCCMIPTEALREGVSCSEPFEWDIHTSVMKCLEAKGLRAYYTPEVYLQHVSSDGKIYRKGLD